MKKRTLVTICSIVLVILVAGCFGIYGYLNYIQDKNAEPFEVFSCLPSEIVEYSVKNGDESYTLVKDKEEWHVEGNEVAVLDGNKVQDVVNGASRIVSQGTLGKRKLKDFDEIYAQSLSIKLTNGEKYVIKFVGIKDEVCAIRINGSEDAYSVHKSIREILLADLDKLRASLVFEELKGTDEVLTFYSFTDYDNQKTVVRTKTAEEISKAAHNRYIMTEPYRKDVDDDKFEQQIVVRIPSIAATKYVDDFPEDMAEYGLDEESRAVLNFRWGDFDGTLYIGEEIGGQIYAVKKGQKGVFVINSSQLEFLNTEPFFILESGLLKSDVENIASVTVRTKEKTFEITGTNGQFFVDGKTASQVAFEEITEKLGNLEILREVENPPKDNQDIVLAVNFEKGYGTQAISLAKLNDNEYAAFINGKAEFAVSRKTVDELLGILNEISKNPMRTK